MFGRLLCKLGFHDWIPYQRPRVAGFCTETPCRCSRCKKALTIIEVFSDSISRKWKGGEYDGHF